MLKDQPRKFTKRIDKDTQEALGPLQHLPGTWKSADRGWNMIALPFEKGPFNYRLLLNQYQETLKFTLVDKGVPNRGLEKDQVPNDGPDLGPDQFLVTIDYEQSIKQLAATDAFDDSGNTSGLEGEGCLPIHHEPGLWLHMIDERTDGLDIARLATIPHGDSVLALGKSDKSQGTPDIPRVSGLPSGLLNLPPDPNESPCVGQLGGRYLSPYKFFHDNPFKGTVNAPGFPGFDPVEPQKLLELANQGVDIVENTILEVDTEVDTGGISNIPFIVKQANAASMKSTFWIQELKEKNPDGSPKLRLQYLQVVRLDFFPRGDGTGGLIEWPHVSINTLEKVGDDVKLPCD
jgi:hypothetical protein